MLSEPESYANWWDATTRSIVPRGTATPGQVICTKSAAFGRNWDVTIRVEAVDAARRHLDLTTALPLGITVHNHITCTPVDESACQVSFG
jgi:hypothetical protein